MRIYWVFVSSREIDISQTASRITKRLLTEKGLTLMVGNGYIYA